MTQLLGIASSPTRSLHSWWCLVGSSVCFSGAERSIFTGLARSTPLIYPLIGLTTRVPRLTRTPSKRACCSVFAGLSLRVLSTSTMAEGMEVEAAPAIRDKKRFEVKKVEDNIHTCVLSSY